MNKRMVSLIYRLSQSGAGAAIDSLAEEFKVSPRTIRNDLKAIGDLLRENHLSELKIKSGMVSCGEDFEQALLLTEDQDFYNYKLSREERIGIAASILVSSSEYTTLSAIADSLFVSRATVIHDLDEIKAFVRRGGLEVFSHPNKGLRVEGAESDKRIFLMKLTDTKFGGKIQDGPANHISVQAGDKIIVQKILNEQEHIHGSFFTDGSFHKILRYLGIMIHRSLQGEFMEPRERVSNSKYRMAQDIMRYIVQYCRITTTEEEVWFLSELLSSARYLKNQSIRKDVIQVQMVTRQFIEKISEDLGMNLNDDYDFFENLSNHLASVFQQKKVSYPENPIIDEILSENGSVTETVTKRKNVLQGYGNRELTDKDLE